MIKKVFSVYDTQAKVYVNPFYQSTIGEAVRAFGDAVKDPQNGTLNKHPEDFILYEIGEWNDNSGVIEALIPPSRCAAGSDYKEIVK